MRAPPDAQHGRESVLSLLIKTSPNQTMPFVPRGQERSRAQTSLPRSEAPPERTPPASETSPNQTMPFVPRGKQKRSRAQASLPRRAAPPATRGRECVLSKASCNTLATCFNSVSTNNVAYFGLMETCWNRHSFYLPRTSLNFGSKIRLCTI